jgi:hypothetical protein
MANQIIVTKDHTVQVNVQPTPQVQVQISRAAITTLTDVNHANTADYATHVTGANQPNITNVGTLGNLNVANTITTQDLVVTGNFQVGNLFANSANYANFAGTVITNAQPNITSVGTLSNLSVSGNVSTPLVYSQGMVTQGYDFVQMQYSNSVALPVSPYDIGTGSWFYLDGGGATFQSNITGAFKEIILGNDGGINATGNVSAPYFIGNGSQLTGIVATGGNANYANFAGQAFNVNAANITGTVANSNYSAYAGQANTANLATYATTANAIAGANVSGEVANANFASYANIATTANSVNVANVVGIGNIATTNYDGNAGNVLYGNGGFYALPTISNVANANYANFAGEAFNVNASNITGTVANANFAAYSEQANNANLATFATTANAVALANVSGAGNIASINLDGNVANLLTGNGTFVAIPTVSANANYANFAGQVVDNTQSNITALGILANLSVTGNIDTQNNVTALKYYAATGGDEYSGYGFVGASNSNTAMCMTATDEITFYNNAIETLSLYANNNAKFYANLQANYYFGDGSQLSNINGGNVSNVANANYANFAGQVVDATQSNITAVGTLGNLSVTGTITTGAIDAGNVDISGTTISTLNDLDLQIQANGIHISDTTSSSEVDVFANGVYIKTSGDTYNWQFSDTGNLVLPGNTFAVNYANGSPVNLDGPVANANYANYAGNVVIATQSNITLLGTLTDLYMSNSNVHLGTNAGNNGQGTSIVAIGNSAASGGTIVNHTYVDYDPGTSILTLDNTSGIVLGMTVSGTGFTSGQFVDSLIDSTTVTISADPDSTPSGTWSFNSGQQTGGISIGNNAGNIAQGVNSVSIGTNAGYAGQTINSIAIGNSAGANTQYYGAIAIGSNAGSETQGYQAVAIGVNAGALNQGGAAFAMGNNAGQLNQGGTAVAIGQNAGYSSQGASAIAIGQNAGNSGQQGGAVSIGFNSGTTTQGNSAVAVGRAAGQTTQGANAVAVGRQAGYINQGINSVAVGKFAGTNNQAANSIIINATGANLDQTTANTFTVKPVRNLNSNNVMFYNSTSGEITYSSNVSNISALTINNGNVQLPTKQYDPNGITVGSTANINLMANSSFVDVDYGNGQGGGNLRYGKSSTYVKARGNNSTIATAAVNDIAGRTNYMFYNGTSNVLAAATQTNVTTFNANSNAITTGGQYQIVTGNPLGDQGNANALSNQNLYTFDSAGRLTIIPGAAGGAGSIININTYGGLSGGNASQAQAVIFSRYRGNRDGNLSVQPNDQLGTFSFLGYNGNILYTGRSASIQAVVDSSFTPNANSVVVTNFVLTACGPNFQNNNWFYGNGNVKLHTNYTGTSFLSNDVTLFVRNLDAQGNVSVGIDATVTGNISGANVSINTNGFMKLASYTAAALNAITGSIGWMASVSDSGTLTNPNGMIAFWDTTHSRWSYVADNSAV